jgi:SpoVK/Ycf46/Vps4 family AAA+-type ATPase
MVSPPENGELSPVEHIPTIDQSNDTSVETAMQALNELTGLTAVKAEINTLINFIKVQKAREESGLKTTSLSLHIVFTGNPGTGKTTVARIVAQIYKALGVLTQGQLIETDRSGLIAEYVGQTAVKVNTTVNSALNGVLFIDEAYSIVGDKDDSFGKEAVSTLIKRMEDDRKNLIVILAGYTDQMYTFIDTNPGFKSRFNRYIDFSDYTPEELFAIYESMSLKLDFVLTDKAKLKLAQVLSLAYTNRDETFGNGRYVRNLFEKSMEMQANRIAGIGKLTKDLLRTIEEIDIPD